MAEQGMGNESGNVAIAYTNQHGVERRVSVPVPADGKMQPIPLVEGDTGVLSARVAPEPEASRGE